MAAKKSSSGLAGGILLLLGSVIYLYVVFTWYGSALGPWLNMAYFLAPFVVAAGVLGSISLFFMSIGTMAGKMADKMMSNVLWKFIMIAGLALVIITGGTVGASFWMVIVGFILTYLGGMMASM